MWTQVGTVSPRVPYVLARDAMDRGPAGSLVQARARERALRRAARRPALADRRLWGAALLTACAGALLADRGGGDPLALLLAAAALALVVPLYRPGPGEVELTRQIARERRCARELEPLRAAGWTVLHDRVLPETEHRLPHVLTGPAGVVVVTELPAAGSLWLRDGVLWAGAVPTAVMDGTSTSRTEHGTPREPPP